MRHVVPGGGGGAGGADAGAPRPAAVAGARRALQLQQRRRAAGGTHFQILLDRYSRITKLILFYHSLLIHRVV